MSQLITMVNHLLQTWMAQAAPGEKWQFHALTLDETGGKILGRVNFKDFSGDVLARLTVEDAGENRQVIRLKIEQWPQQMPPSAEAFRKLLEKARLTLELDFTP